MHRKIIRKSIRWISVVLVCTMLLCACGKSTPGQTPDISDKLGGTGAPINGGSINIVMPENPETLSPLEVTSREMADLYGLIYDSLVRYDEQMRPLPGLAERWEASEDGKTWTFYLQKDATFHNGQALAAADVVYTLDQLNAIYADADKTSLYSGLIPLISKYEAIDEHTVAITMKEPSARLLHWLNFPIVQNLSLSDSSNVAAGTGAYRVTSYEAGKQLVLTANENWWRRKPYIATIVAKAMPDPETALTSMDVKLVDVVHSTSLTAHSYKQQDVTNVYELMTQEYECVIPNMNHAALQDVRMRQAVIAALDRKTIITEAYLTHAVSIDVPIPPDSYLYEPTHTQYTYSQSRAQELLAQMGYKDTDGDGIVEKNGVPLRFSIIVNENTLSSARVDAARMAKQQLEAVGIGCDLAVESFSKFQTLLKSGSFDLAFAGFSIPMDGDLRFILQSGASKNYGSYHDGTMDTLLAAFVAALTESEQVNASAAVQKYFAEQLPVISLYFHTNTLVCSASVNGVTGGRDMNIYKAVEEWYILKEGDEDKAATP